MSRRHIHDGEMMHLGPGSEVKLRVSRCHHLWATIVGGGFYFFKILTTGEMIKFEKQIFQTGWL